MATVFIGPLYAIFFSSHFTLFILMPLVALLHIFLCKCSCEFSFFACLRIFYQLHTSSVRNIQGVSEIHGTTVSACCMHRNDEECLCKCDLLGASVFSYSPFYFGMRMITCKSVHGIDFIYKYLSSALQIRSDNITTKIPGNVVVVLSHSALRVLVWGVAHARRS
jgi:hypothetical protein